jgi:molecular chaperone DnaK
MHYTGIDLGTTNSAIASYDGENVRLYKSPSQADVTPSALYFDKRGNKHAGASAYDYSVRDPDNCATAFKRMMGTSTPIPIAALNRTLTPEECSAEILKTLFAYLPEEIRNDPATGTVITVPAAFNQMQKDATSSAAQLAGIGRTALMQEPVAAVMSVVRQRRSDGIFIVYDLGGGTLDTAIAQNHSGHVSLLAHGGVEMKGGRDIDRLIVDRIVLPWLNENFDLPAELHASPRVKRALRIALKTAEAAKIELSQKETSTIAAPESDLNATDARGKELYLDIPFARARLDGLIEKLVDDSIETVKETLRKAALTPRDIDRIVFVGGPVQYKPLRDKVCQTLGIAASTDINPMTAVAEGAAIYAEAIDWSTQSRPRKSSRGSLSAKGPLNLTFQFVSRTPEASAQLALSLGGTPAKGTEFQIDSLDTGWSSGKIALEQGAGINLPLTRAGANLFKIFVFDPAGGPVALAENRITITRTAGAIDAIPASSSIGIEALSRLGGLPSLEYLIREGEPLPKKGTLKFKAAESLRAGSTNALNFKLWEGEIPDPIAHNRNIGCFSIKGGDFDDGVIPAGADLVLDYEIVDSGNLSLKVAVPSVRATFSSRNYYSRQEGAIDFTKAAKRIEEEAGELASKLDAAAQKVSDPRLNLASQKLDDAIEAANTATDPELQKQALDQVHDAKKLLAEVRETHRKTMRLMDLERCIEHFHPLRSFARPAEETSFDNLALAAKRAANEPPPQFESLLNELWGKTFGILMRQDWWIADRFNYLAENPHLFASASEHAALIEHGRAALKSDDISKLREILALMEQQRIGPAAPEDLLNITNIVKT